MLDKDLNGIISFEEFALWWRRDEVTYVLKRSEPVVGPRAVSSSAEVRASTASLAFGSRGGGGSIAGGGAARAGNACRLGGLGGIPEDRSVTGSVLRAGTAAAGAKRAAVEFPITSYRGPDLRAVVAGLEANRYYHLKLRFSGSRCNSNLSQSLCVMTCPLQPSAPLLLDVTATSARIKWYPPPNGAFKFLVQVGSSLHVHL